MKILVFSDSHGESAGMMRAVLKETPDAVFHLGDVVFDVQSLRARFPRIGIYCVSGNCDFGFREPESRIFEQDGVRIFMTHGHIYHVKQELGAAVGAASAQNAAILLFGHTHIPLYTLKDGLHVLNPGSISGVHTARKTYGVINLNKTGFVCRIAELEEASK
jgi:putative phosphoesterase